MANQPYLPLYTGDWKKDPELSMCSPATRGIWIDLLCSLHDARISQLTGTPEQLARLCRCDTGLMGFALQELQSTGAANVSNREGVFTVVCRRMKKAENISRKRAEAGSIGGAKGKQRESNPWIGLEDEDDSSDKAKERVLAFAREERIPDRDADWFFNKCEGNGWTNGGKPIRDWKATMRSWRDAGYFPSQRQSNNGQRQFASRLKERAPSYPELPPKREPTTEEIAKAKEIAENEVAKLREQFRMPT